MSLMGLSNMSSEKSAIIERVECAQLIHVLVNVLSSIKEIDIVIFLGILLCYVVEKL